MSNSKTNKIQKRKRQTKEIHCAGFITINICLARAKVSEISNNRHSIEILSIQNQMRNKTCDLEVNIQ